MKKLLKSLIKTTIKRVSNKEKEFIDINSKPNNNSESETNFGYKKVKMKNKQSMVDEVFSSVASKYDIMNDVSSMGIHRLWKQTLIEEIGILKPKRIFEEGKIKKIEPIKILDVATGTGDIAYNIIDYQKKYADNPNLLHKSLKVTLVDVNADILEIAKEKSETNNIDANLIDFHVSSAEKMEFIEDNTYDIYVISFGLRNVPDIPKALKEAYRVLKPGGRFLCMEFSKVENPIFSQIYKEYIFNVIPIMGKVITNDSESYTYLAESIDQFHDQETLKGMLEDAGFGYVSYENLTNGICAIHSGFKLN